MNTEVPSGAPATEDRSVAILSYLTIIGFIVAIVLHSSGKKSALGAYHLRQALGLMIAGFAAGIVGGVLAMIPILGFLAVLAIWGGLLVMWIMGLIAAAGGQQKPMPILGAQFEKWFAGAFN